MEIKGYTNNNVLSIYMKYVNARRYNNLTYGEQKVFNAQVNHSLSIIIADFFINYLDNPNLNAHL
jgi:hypothetical protein